MRRFLALVLICTVSLWGKDVPLTPSKTIYVPLKGWVAIEFPFKIKDKSFTPFVSIVEKEDVLAPLKEQIEVPKIAKGGTSSKLSKGSKPGNPPVKKYTPLDVEAGVNTIQLFPKKKGETELIIWGHKYPVILKIVVDEKLGESHYRFVDYDLKEDLAAKFEEDPHVTVVQKLVKALYDKEAPKGYREKSFFSEYDEVGRKHVLVQTFYGKRYIGEEWRVTNISNAEDALYNEQFLDTGVYAASVQNNVLLPGETTRVFVIRKYDKSEYKE